MRLLIVGCGSIGGRHARNLRALGAHELLLQDVDERRWRPLASALGVRGFTDLGDALASSPDAVVVANPTSCHIATAMAAVRAGCHLFIEKPFSHSLDGVDDLIALVRSRRLKTLVACNLRFDPGLAATKASLDAGAIGRLLAMRIQFGYYLPDWHPNEDYRAGYSARKDLGGGVLLDAIHEIDYARWLGGEVSQVSGVIARVGDLAIETEDLALVWLRFASGTVAEIHLDYLNCCYTRNCELLGTEGTLRWDFGSGLAQLYRGDRREWQTVGRRPEGCAPDQMYMAEMAHFLRCLQGRESSAQDVVAGREALAIALAAKNSSAKGETIGMGRPAKFSDADWRSP